MIELLAHRRENSKTYSLGVTPDKKRQRYRTVIGGDIEHYHDGEGWQDCDLSVPETPPAGWTHYFSKNRVRVLVDVDRGRIAILPFRDDDTKYVLFRAHPSVDVPISLAVLGKTALRLYRDTPNANYSFTVSANGVKPEAIVFNSSVSSWQMGFKLNNLQRVGRKVMDGERELFTLPDAFLEDFDGKRRGVQEAVIGDVATLTWDDTGLTYPLVVDPTLTMTQPTQDSFMWELHPTDNYNGGTFSVRGQIDANIRGILGYDGATGIPKVATITTATLTLWMSGKFGAIDGAAASFYPLTNLDWLEAQVCWDNRKTGAAWGTAGGDYAAGGRSAVTLNNPFNTSEYHSFNVLDCVRYCQENLGGRIHFIVKLDDETTEDIVQFVAYAKDAVDPAKRPVIYIEYTVALTDGIVAIYHLNNSEEDASGNGNTLTRDGSNFNSFTKKLGSHSLNFDGNNDTAYAANESNFDFAATDQFSLSFWMWSGNTTADKNIIAKCGGEAPYQGWWVEHASGNIYFVRCNNWGSNVIDRKRTNTYIGASAWHHVVVTCDGTNGVGMMIYVNGSAVSQFVDKNTLVGASILNDSPFRLGGWDFVSLLFNGFLDEVVVWKGHPLSQDEVDTLYNGGTGIEVGMPLAGGFYQALLRNRERN